MGSLGLTFDDEFSFSRENLSDLKKRIEHLEHQAVEKDKTLVSLKQIKSENQREIMFLREQNQRVTSLNLA